MNQLTEAQVRYRRFLRTECWKWLRDKALQRDGWTCCRCGGTKGLHVHHLSYPESWEDTELTQLQTLCKACHRKEHGLGPGFSYTPVFEKIIDSSIWQEALFIRVLWVSMLALKRRDHIVHLNVNELSVQCHMPQADVEAGLLVLSSPDRIHIGQPDDGRRIEKVEDGWFILNGERYQKEMQAIYARARKRRWAEKRRAKKGPPLTFESQGVKADEAGDRPLAEKLAEPPIL